MKKILLIMLSLLAIISMALSGCAGSQTPSSTQNHTSITGTNGDASSDEWFSSRDLSGEVDTATAVEIVLSGNTATTGSDSVSVAGSTVTVTSEGTYVISGTLQNGSIVVNVGKDEKVQLVLNGVSITSKTFAPIYVAQADKVFITLADGTENSLVNGGSFQPIDDNAVDAVIYSKDDITLNGTGTLTIQSPAGHGIVGKDDVTIAGGTYLITASQTAIRANDSIAVADGNFTIQAGADGLHAEHNDDDSMGSVFIADGTFTIQAGDDAVHATTTLQIDGGTLTITAAEGLEATYIQINGGTIAIKASDDGINAAKKSSAITPAVEINGGYITIVMGQGDTDGVDSNGNITINGGTIDVTGNSTFDYDGTGVINGGTVIVNGSQVSTLPNQMMGGPGGGPGGDFGGRGGFRPRG